jgi:hypothetical protein
MSISLAAALLVGPAIPACSWDRPGVNPFMGDVVAAVDRYRDIPKPVREKLKARMAARQYEDIAVITRDGVSGKADYSAEIRDMHFGQGTICRSVTRTRWSASHQERGLVYCEAEHCIIVPTVCRNVSRITRLPTKVSSAEEEVLAPPSTPEEPSRASSHPQDDAAPRTARSPGSVDGGGGAEPPLLSSLPSTPAAQGWRAAISGVIASTLGTAVDWVRDTVGSWLPGGQPAASTPTSAAPRTPLVAGQGGTPDALPPGTPAAPGAPAAALEPATLPWTPLELPTGPTLADPLPAAPGLLQVDSGNPAVSTGAQAVGTTPAGADVVLPAVPAAPASPATPVIPPAAPQSGAGQPGGEAEPTVPPASTWPARPQAPDPASVPVANPSGDLVNWIEGQIVANLGSPTAPNGGTAPVIVATGGSTGGVSGSTGGSGDGASGGSGGSLGDGGGGSSSSSSGGSDGAPSSPGTGGTGSGGAGSGGSGSGGSGSGGGGGGSGGTSGGTTGGGGSSTPPADGPPSSPPAPSNGGTTSPPAGNTLPVAGPSPNAAAALSQLNNVPEPGTLALLMVAGLLALVHRRQAAGPQATGR